jgi:hypothetical protein
MRNLLRLCVTTGVVALALSTTAVVAAPGLSTTSPLAQSSSNVQSIRWRLVCDRHGHHCRRVWVRDHHWNHWR